MTNITIENIVCKDFTTYGIQLNGFDNVKLIMQKLVQVHQRQIRALLPRFRSIAEKYTQDYIKFAGKQSACTLGSNLKNNIDYNLNDIIDELVEQMDLAYEYVTDITINKIDQHITYNEMIEKYGNQWKSSHNVFVRDEQNGIPYGAVMYGLLLNHPSSSIPGFYKSIDESNNIEINNLYISRKCIFR